MKKPAKYFPVLSPGSRKPKHQALALCVSHFAGEHTFWPRVADLFHNHQTAPSLTLVSAALAALGSACSQDTNSRIHLYTYSTRFESIRSAARNKLGDKFQLRDVLGTHKVWLQSRGKCYCENKCVSRRTSLGWWNVCSELMFTLQCQQNHV